MSPPGADGSLTTARSAGGQLFIWPGPFVPPMSVLQATRTHRRPHATLHDRQQCCVSPPPPPQPPLPLDVARHRLICLIFHVTQSPEELLYSKKTLRICYAVMLKKIFGSVSD